MSQILSNWYYTLTLRYPLVTLLIVILFCGGALYTAQDFKLDASADSLVLESDKDLQYYRGIRGRYGSDDFLFVAYTPEADILADETLAQLRQMRDELVALERVGSVISVLDVPLIDSPRVTFNQLRRATRILETPGVDRTLALKEFTNSRLYRNLLMSPDGRTTTLQINFKRDERYNELLSQRDALRAKQLAGPLSTDDQFELERVGQAFKLYSAQFQDQGQVDIAAVRSILDRYRNNAEIHLGGVPMITSDMIDFVRSDIVVFGVGVALFIVVLLAIAFRLPRWVILPVTICAAAGLGMVGFLGLVEWRVTVVSSNFISLMLTLTLALAVHLIVRYEELHHERPDADHLDRIRETIDSKFLPSLFTALTTMVAFASLIFSGIRPVIDFGWMMVVGVGIAFVLAFLLFPACVVLLKQTRPIFRKVDVTAVITSNLASLVERHGRLIGVIFLAIIVLSISGLFRLTVENRFIDYFKDDTEIHQGMLLIDRKLGGTTPLDVLIDPDAEFSEPDPENDEFEDMDAGITGESYWFNVFQLEVVGEIHKYLESLPETGKVLSMDTTMAMLTQLNQDDPIDNLTLAVMHKRMPPDIKKTLFDPYMSEDGNQMRFAIRVIDSDPDLKRDELIKRIKRDLVEKFKLEEGQVHLSGMLVLYNNVLQSLFQSQILTLGAVFIAIVVMLAMLFRSVTLAAIGVIPTMVAAGLILGLMGWLGIPLDIMTITIAAITIGIGVDNTIHYTHRIREEFAESGDYWAAVRASHGSVGRAIYYTSVTITLGFSILVLSNFIPTIYFGLLTGLAMVVALIANLTLLPLLIVFFKPLGAPIER